MKVASFGGSHIIDQRALENPPRSKSSELFFLAAIGAVGRSIYADEWRDAEREPRLNDEASIMVRGAFDALLQKMLDEELSAHLLPDYEGATLESLDIDLLRNPRSTDRLLSHGQISYIPPSYSNDRTNGAVFVASADVRRLFPEQSRAPDLLGTDVAVLSPYLQLAITVAMECNISEDNASDTNQLAAEVLQAAPRFGLTVGGKPGDDISQSFAIEIAKAIRFPSARAGRGKVTNQKT